MNCIPNLKMTAIVNQSAWPRYRTASRLCPGLGHVHVVLVVKTWLWSIPSWKSRLHNGWNIIELDFVGIIAGKMRCLRDGRKVNRKIDHVGKTRRNHPPYSLDFVSIAPSLIIYGCTMGYKQCYPCSGNMLLTPGDGLNHCFSMGSSFHQPRNWFSWYESWYILQISSNWYH